MALVFLMGDETPFVVKESREDVLAALHDVAWASVVHLTLNDDGRSLTVRAPLVGAVADDEDPDAA